MSLLFPKLAAGPDYAMAGRLYQSPKGWLLLSVPNAIMRGVFDTIEEPGIELPPTMGRDHPNAHITVMRPEETQERNITERGHSFHYTLGPLKSYNPSGWNDVSKCWVIEVRSPELQNLRKSYGLSKLPNDHAFHITVAVRKKNVLNPGDVAKAAGVAGSLLPFPARLAHSG